MDWSNYIGIGGAVVAIATLSWRIYEWRLKQARINLSIAGGLLSIPGEDILEGFAVSIVNSGKEAIKIKSIGFMCKRREQLILFPEDPFSINCKFQVVGKPLPYELKGNDSCTVWIRKDVLLSEPKVERPVNGLHKRGVIRGSPPLYLLYYLC